jgi:uncharacterized protein
MTLKTRRKILILLVTILLCTFLSAAQQADFHVLVLYSTKTEPDHVQFSDGALEFFKSIAAKDHFTLDATTNWDDLNAANLSKYQVVVWLNDFPNNDAQRQAFQQYVDHGGAWLGFHVSAYNDSDTHWPWFVNFLGGGVFDTNSWPPLPAKLVVDDRSHPVTAGLPVTYESPSNEWYIWKPSPRLNPDVHVLVTLDPSNYPLGLKDVLLGGDLPVVWTNTKYKMLYMNMGHGNKVLTSPTQNKMFENAILWLGTGAKQAKPAPAGMRVSPRAVVVNPKTSKAYTVNVANGTVTVAEAVRNSAAEIKVGADPVAVAVNPALNKIYVANSGSGTVSVIDGASDQVSATVKVGDFPYVVAVNPATGKVYVSRTFSNDMAVIDGTTNAVSTLKAGAQANSIAVNSATGKLYLAGYEGNDVTVLDGNTDTFSKIAVGNHLWGTAVNSATNRIYFTNSGAASISVLDGSTNAVSIVATGEIPSAVAVDESTNKVYVANYGSDSVTVIDGSTNKPVATIKVGSRPQAIAVSPESHQVVVANTYSDNVTVIDATNNSVFATINVPGGPYAIAAATHKIYVATLAGRSFMINRKMLLEKAHDGSAPNAAPVIPPVTHP